MPISDKHSIIFVQIPRTGGHTISQIIEQINNYKGLGRHANVTQYKNSYPNKFTTYKKIIFIRNTWDRIYSAWHRRHFKAVQQELHLHNNNPDLFQKEELQNRILDYYSVPFNEWVSNYLPSAFNYDLWLHPQLYWYTEWGQEFNWDFVGIFEDFENEINRLCEEFDIPKTDIKNYSNTKRDASHYSEHYSEKSKKIIEDYYAQEIDMFNYQY